MAQVLEFLSPIWENQIEIRVTGFGLAQPQLLQVSGEWTTTQEISLSLSTFQINKINSLNSNHNNYDDLFLKNFIMSLKYSQLEPPNDIPVYNS